MQLLSEMQLFEDRTIAIDVLLLEIVEKISSVTDHLQHTAAAVVVLGVLLEMLIELVDSRGKNRDLYLGRTGIGLMGLVGSDHCLLCVLLNHGIHLIKYISQNTAHGR